MTSPLFAKYDSDDSDGSVRARSRSPSRGFPASAFEYLKWTRCCLRARIQYARENASSLLFFFFFVVSRDSENQARSYFGDDGLRLVNSRALASLDAFTPSLIADHALEPCECRTLPIPTQSLHTPLFRAQAGSRGAPRAWRRQSKWSKLPRGILASFGDLYLARECGELYIFPDGESVLATPCVSWETALSR